MQGDLGEQFGREFRSCKNEGDRERNKVLRTACDSAGLSLRFQVAGYLLLVAGEVASSHGAPSPPPPRSF